jgi:hypothetical protein
MRSTIDGVRWSSTKGTVAVEAIVLDWLRRTRMESR